MFKNSQFVMVDPVESFISQVSRQYFEFLVRSGTAVSTAVAVRPRRGAAA